MNVPVLLAALLPLLPTVRGSSEAALLPSLLETAEQAGTFTTLAAALDAAGLTGALDGDEPLTVFAPTDEAFARLPAGTVESLLQPERRDDLIAVLTYHVVPGDVSGIEALEAGSAQTLQGESLAFSLEGGALRVNDATVLSNDVPTRNGVIHVIDDVLLPPVAPDPALGLLTLAIDRGVPLFNAGQPEACAAIYEVAARALATMPCNSVPAEAVATLQSALDVAADQRSASTRAWTLRTALDRTAWLIAQPDATAAAPATPRPRDLVVYDFASGAQPWKSVNDDVMGGISRGGCRITEDGTAVFLGQLSLENNGGFSTIRSPDRDLDLAGWDGLLLRVRGDGRTYNVSALRNDDPRELNYWQQSFDTVADEWIEVRVPFARLSHRVMGWVRPNSPIDPAMIRSLAFGVSDKQTTPFALEIDSIRAYREG